MHIWSMHGPPAALVLLWTNSSLPVPCNPTSSLSPPAACGSAPVDHKPWHSMLHTGGTAHGWACQDATRGTAPHLQHNKQLVMQGLSLLLLPLLLLLLLQAPEPRVQCH